MLDKIYHYFILVKRNWGLTICSWPEFLFTNCVTSELHFWLLQIFVSFPLNMTEFSLIYIYIYIYFITDMKMFKVVCYSASTSYK